MKKVISMIMGMIVATSLIGCKSAVNNTENKSDVSVETKSASDSVSQDSDNNEDLEGKWGKNYTLDEAQQLFKEKLSNMKSITKDLGVKYTEDQKTSKENNESVTDQYMYFDNENPEANKIESMYFGMKTYGDNLETGDISLKLSLNFDSENAIKDNNFDLGNTSFKKYIEAFTEEKDRDYSSINKEILEKLKNGDKEVDITNTVNGLKEEIIATKDCILYKLSTKKYTFSNGEKSTN